MVKSLLVVNYPTISTESFDWIQHIRKQHDHLYWEVVAHHFTIVFPVFRLEEQAFIHHIEYVVKEVEAFDFVLRCAVLGDDAFSDFTHVFLVPDEGYSSIVKLQDVLKVLSQVATDTLPLFLYAQRALIPLNPFGDDRKRGTWSLFPPFSMGSRGDL